MEQIVNETSIIINNSIQWISQLFKYSGYTIAIICPIAILCIVIYFITVYTCSAKNNNKSNIRLLFAKDDVEIVSSN